MMCASRSSAGWPQVVTISLLGLGLANCSANSGRFSDVFGADSAPRGEVTGSIPPSGNRVETRPLPHLAGSDGSSGGGHGLGSYQPGGGDVTGSLSAAPPPPSFTWEGGTPITVAPGETLETISRRHGVPVAAIMEANSITNPATVRPGQHLVIPRRRGPVSALSAAPQTSTARTVPTTTPVGPPRTALTPTANVHVVAPGETLHSIARLYGKPVMMLAKANNIQPNTMVKVGDRITVPGGGPPVAAASPPAVAAPRGENTVGSIASTDFTHSARLAAPVAPEGEQAAVKAAEPAGSLPCVSLAGARPGHRRLRAEAERPAERRHQSRSARRHAGQGSRRRRGRLCRKRA